MKTSRLNLLALVAITLLLTVSVLAAEPNKPAPAPAEPNFATMSPDEVLAKYGPEKLTLREVKYFIPIPDTGSVGQLCQQWLDIQMLYDAAQKRGITTDPKAKMLSELNRKQAFAKTFMEKIGEVNIPDANVKAYYEANKETDPRLSEPVRLSFTHVKTNTLEEAAAAKKRIDSGEDIEKVAKELSTAPDAKTGGSVKKAPAAMLERQFGKEFADTMLASSEGKIVGPMKVNDGYEIARHEGKLSQKPKPYDQVKETIKKTLEDRAKSTMTRRTMLNLREESKSKIYLSPIFQEPEPSMPKSENESNLPVDKNKTKTDNAPQKK